MQLIAEETLFCKPANYIRVAAAAGFGVVCVQMCLIAFVYACMKFMCTQHVCLSHAILPVCVCVRLEVYSNAHVYMSSSVC